MNTDEELQKDVEMVNKGKSYFLAGRYCRPIIWNVNLNHSICFDIGDTIRVILCKDMKSAKITAL